MINPEHYPETTIKISLDEILNDIDLPWRVVTALKYLCRVPVLANNPQSFISGKLVEDLEKAETYLQKEGKNVEPTRYLPEDNCLLLRYLDSLTVDHEELVKACRAICQLILSKHYSAAISYIHDLTRYILSAKVEVCFTPSQSLK